jgi:hypothetical protein
MMMTTCLIFSRAVPRASGTVVLGAVGGVIGWDVMAGGIVVFCTCGGLLSCWDGAELDLGVVKEQASNKVMTMITFKTVALLNIKPLYIDKRDDSETR